jgi:hypothetical protein
MSLSKDKKRKKKVDKEDKIDMEDVEEIIHVSETTRKKRRKSKDTDGNRGPPQNKSKVSKSEAVVSRSASVHLGSLQSIFASKDDEEEERQFSLFGSEPVSKRAVEPTQTDSTLISQRQGIEPPQPGAKRLYFFPHYDDPRKNAESLFPMSDEPFYHNRTEYVQTEYV